MSILKVTDLRDPNNPCSEGDVLLIGPKTLGYPHHIQSTVGGEHDYSSCAECLRNIETIEPVDVFQ